MVSTCRLGGRVGSPLVALWAFALGTLGGPPGASAQILSPGRLSTAHAELEGIRQCTGCHELGTRGISGARCLECHVVIADRLEEGLGLHASLSSNCASCHQEHLGRDFDVRRLDERTFDHTATGYDLLRGHAAVGCRECHRPENVRDARVATLAREQGTSARTFLGLSRDCASCHARESPHGGQLAGRGCAECHDEAKWDRATAFDHGRAAFRLEGRHATIECAGCHGAPPDEVVYRPIPFGSCGDCHQDPHRGAMRGSCASCHGVDGWTALAAGAVENGFDHSRTDYPLLGAHASAECTDCHRRGRAPTSESIRIRYRPGTESSTYPRPQFESCASCHVDRHAMPGLEQRWTECATCHVETRWAPSSYDVARHVRASLYPLDGAHAVTPCFACHQDPAQGHATFVLGLSGRRCADCHGDEDPHAGLYGELACEACHTTTAFDEVTFDHGRVVATAAASPEATRCASCHAAEDPHRDQFGDRDCSACHAVERFTIQEFDHARTRMPLDGAHDDLSCASCHRPESDADGTFVRYRPLGSQCADCHREVP